MKHAVRASNVRLKRAYQPCAPDDGMRVLIDRLWPRGVSKEQAKLDVWLKEIAPSAALRMWFDHDSDRWAEFRRRYRDELKHSPLAHELREQARNRPITLVYSAKDEIHNDAIVLRNVLLGRPIPQRRIR